MNPQLSPKAIREIREGTCNPLGAPQVTTDLSENIILTSLDDLHNWARLSSLWPLLYGTACCFIEFAALIGSRFDFDRFGLVPRSSPRQADLLIVAGTVTMKMAPALEDFMSRCRNQNMLSQWVLAQSQEECSVQILQLL